MPQEPKFTEGPWYVAEEREACFGEKIVRRTIYYKVKVGKGYAPVQVQLNSVGNKYPEAKGNALLQAAAPRLYAALVRVEKWLEQHGTPEVQGVACDVFAALAAVKGEV